MSRNTMVLLPIFLVLMGLGAAAQQIMLDDADLPGFWMEQQYKNHWVNSLGETNDHVDVQKWINKADDKSYYLEVGVYENEELAIETAIHRSKSHHRRFIQMRNPERIIGNKTWISVDQSVILIQFEACVFQVYHPGIVDNKGFDLICNIGQTYVDKLIQQVNDREKLVINPPKSR